jgi:outer membrane protein W
VSISLIKIGENMKKIVISTIIATTLATNMMAEVKPYIGLGYHSFGIYTKGKTSTNKITGATATSKEETVDIGSTIGLNGGVILSDNSKINFIYFSGKEKDSEMLKTTVVAISYDYSFNNSGVRKGFYIGAGFSSIKTEIEENPLFTTTSASEAGLLLRGGYEYQTKDNILFDIGLNTHTSEQKLKYDLKTTDDTKGNTTTIVGNLNISVNYIF